MLRFETAYSRGEIPKADMNEEQWAVIEVFGAMGAAISIGMTNVETVDDLNKFMSRVRFWEKFSPLANEFVDGVLTPHSINAEAVSSLMPIRTNVFPEIKRDKFVKNIVVCYGDVE